MTFTRSTPFSSGISKNARLQMVIYIGLLVAALGLLLPWPGQTPTVIANQILQSVLVATVVVLSIRHYQLQARVRRLEQRLHQMSPSQSRNYDYQPLPRMEVDQFFSKEQTRH